MKATLVVIGLPVFAAFGSSIALFARELTSWSAIQLVGAMCMVMVVIVHVAESLHVVPSMNWGLPNSAGHYVDLVSAVSGIVLFPMGYLCRIVSRRKNST